MATPVVTAAEFNYQTLPHSLAFVFSQDVSGALSCAAVRVQSLTADAAPTPTALDYDHATNTATFRFAGQVPSGRYRATLFASAVTDLAGKHPAADFELDFFFLLGDANHDGKVDWHDMQLIAKNYNRRNASYAQGDLNYDGVVDFADMLILMQNYDKSLPDAGKPEHYQPPRFPVPKPARPHRSQRRRKPR